MPLSNGFPPSNLISPSVRIAENDLTFISSSQSGHVAGIIGFASKGPINIPTSIGTSSQLHSIFGIPHPDSGDPFMLYAADQYLFVANQVFIVRVADVSPTSSESATTASVIIPTAGGPVQIVGNIPVGSGWTFIDNTFFRWRLNGTLASKVLVVLPGTYATADLLVNALNEQLVPSIDGIQFYYTNPSSSGGPTSASQLGVQTTFSYGSSASLELVSVTQSLYGPSSVVGMGTLMTPASVTGTATQYPTSSVSTPGIFNFSGFAAGALNLQIVMEGTDNVLIDNVVQTVQIESTSQTISAIVAEINAQITMGTIPGGFIASVTGGTNLTLTTNTVGEDSVLLVKAASTADGLFGLSNLTSFGGSPSCVTSPGATYTCAIVTGNPNSIGTTCFTIYADSPGIDGNNTQIIITDSTTDGTFTITVFAGYGVNINQVENWATLTKNPTSQLYVESFISTVSNYIRVVDNTATQASPLGNTTSNPYVLAGGTDGIPSDPDDQDSLLIGSLTSMTGLQALSDPEQIDIDLIAIPGHTSTAVVLALLNFCQNVRQDCFAIIDSPFGLSVTEIVQWQNGVHPLNMVQFNSDFGALYWPWLNYTDVFNQINVWVPPSGSVMQAYANSDILTAPWYAPAGTTRGLIQNINNVFTAPSGTERDQMYGNQNAVNPIIVFSDLNGLYIWGQKTLLREPTALNRVNVRRMLLYIEKTIRANARNLLFEPNGSALWAQFITLATQTLKSVQSARGISNFIVQCDSSINTSTTIEMNILNAKIGVIPVYAAEYIFIQFSLNTAGFTTSA